MRFQVSDPVCGFFLFADLTCCSLWSALSPRFWADSGKTRLIRRLVPPTRVGAWLRSRSTRTSAASQIWLRTGSSALFPQWHLCQWLLLMSVLRFVTATPFSDCSTHACAFAATQTLELLQARATAEVVGLVEEIAAEVVGATASTSLVHQTPLWH